MEFKKKLKVRLYTAILYAVIGIALIIINIFTPNEMLSSFGAVMLVIGIVRIVQYMRITKDEDSIHSREVAETDERNVMIWTRARSMAFSVYIMISAMAVIVLYLFKQDYIAQVVGIMLAGFVVIYWICYFFISKKY
ncbi:MAG: hypothetical protein ACI4C7_06050 [Clostridia bacterium]